MLAPDYCVCLEKLILFGFAKSRAGIGDTQTSKVRVISAAATSSAHLVLVLFREEDGRPQTHNKAQSIENDGELLPSTEICPDPPLVAFLSPTDLLILLDCSTNTWLR